MDILTLEKFKQDLINFINNNQQIMLQFKYYILLCLCESIESQLKEKQYQLDIEGLNKILKENDEKIYLYHIEKEENIKDD